MSRELLTADAFEGDRDMYDIGRQFLVGGVGATTRSCPALGHPLYITSASGCRIVTESGRSLIDAAMSNGVLPYGHNHSKITERLQKSVASGIRTGFDSKASVELASRLCESFQGVEHVRYALSGTEATMHALRIARAATSRDLVLKCHGHFHGYHDYLQFNWFSPCMSYDVDPAFVAPRVESAGIPAQIEGLVSAVRFNDVQGLEQAFSSHGHEIAAFILEPVAINAGCVYPTSDFLRTARHLCDTHGALLVFDEILSGYRTSTGGAQKDFGVVPDLCTLGKVIGGGLPLSVVGGRREIMSVLNPIGPVTFSGTFPGLPLTMEVALSVLDVLSAPDFYRTLHERTTMLISGLRRIFRDAGIVARIQEYGDRFSILFGLDADEQCFSVQDALRAQRGTLRAFCRGALEAGVFMRECSHHGISTAHGEDDVAELLDRLAAGVSSASVREAQRAEAVERQL